MNRIVFSHGNSFPSGTYSVLFEHLRARGFEVSAVDRFGHDPRFPVTDNWPHLVEQLAEFAAEQGREIFAVPGSILAPQSKGTNRLIQKGALPLLTPDDLMQALDLTRIGAQKSARKILPADETEARVLNVLGSEPLHVDEIRNQAGLPIEKISATLALMELKGMVRQVGGMNYVAMRENQ